MTRNQQTVLLGIAIPVTIIGLLAAAHLGSGGSCVLAFPRWIGCVLAAHEGLSAGLIGAGGAIFAAWLVWSAVRDQIAEGQAATRGGQQQAFASIQRELGPLLDLWNVVWRMIEDALDREGEDDAQRDRIAAVRMHVAFVLPAIDIVDHLEGLAEHLAPVQRRRFSRIASNLRLLYRRVDEFRTEKHRVDESNWRLHEFKLVIIQLSHLRNAAIRFDEAAGKRFEGRHPVAITQETWAKQLEELHGAWLEQDARRRHGGKAEPT